ncbi:MFS general substrate transporter [Microthyrium microscopicum]|uniref:MFS general substrate transporter n=1 Tax=Microthyrium microscopicum TaxID=703497 RepID=A0A6A6UKG6_9PEZI|nr:MFS general substrate transporter [Microthyrium microscopicum]
MSTQAFGAFFDVESAPVKGPELARTKASAVPTAVELEEYTTGGQYNGPVAPIHETESQYTFSARDTPGTGTQTPARLNNPSGTMPPGQHDVSYIVPTFNDPPMNKWRVLACCLVYFTNGMNDAAPGALIPYMEKHYHVGYAIVSLIFVSQAIGFIGAAFFNDALKSKIGQAKTLIFSELIKVLAFTLIAITPPYPVVVVAFFLLGWAMAINLALINVFLANLAGSTTILGLSQGMYGVGGTIGPFIATTLVSHGSIWSRFYLITLAFSTVGAAVAGITFHGIESEPGQSLHAALERTASQQRAANPPKRTLLVQALRDRVTPFGALFTFAYQGAEVAISGWVISFLIAERGGDPAKVGYATAGFWGGITLGRFTLAPLSAKYDQKRFIHALGLAAIAFQLLVWLVPNVIGDSVAVAMVGFVLGPIAPCSVAYFVRLLPRGLHTTAIGFISSAGSSGGAAAPFLTGLVAQAKGTWVLHPICIGLFVLMGTCWYCLPTVEKRSE